MASSASISVVTDRFMVNPSCYDRYILFALGSGFASVTNLVGQFIGNDGTKVRSLDALGSLLDGAARGGVMTTLTVLIDPPIDAMLIGLDSLADSIATGLTRLPVLWPNAPEISGLHAGLAVFAEMDGGSLVGCHDRKFAKNSARVLEPPPLGLQLVDEIQGLLNHLQRELGSVGLGNVGSLATRPMVSDRSHAESGARWRSQNDVWIVSAESGTNSVRVQLGYVGADGGILSGIDLDGNYLVSRIGKSL